jgi:hypothetical protein
VPALALGLVGLGAFAAGVLVAIRPGMGMVLSAVVGAGMMVFELVETSVVGWDLWVHALGLGPIRKGLPAVDTSGIPAPLGIPVPLWPQPTMFLLGAGILALAAGLWRGRARPRPRRLTTAARAAMNTAICLLKVFPMLPSRPLDWVTPRPVVERFRYPTSYGPAEGDRYRQQFPDQAPTRPISSRAGYWLGRSGRSGFGGIRREGLKAATGQRWLGRHGVLIGTRGLVR